MAVLLLFHAKMSEFSIRDKGVYSGLFSNQGK